MNELKKKIDGLRIVDDDFIKTLIEIKTKLDSIHSKLSDLLLHFDSNSRTEDSESVVDDFDNKISKIDEDNSSESSFIVTDEDDRIMRCDPAMKGDKGKYHVTKKKLKQYTPVIGRRNIMLKKLGCMRSRSE